MYHNWELFIGVLCFNYCHTLLSLSVFSLEGQCTLQLLRRICRLPRGKHDFQQQHTNVLHTILRDPGAVSRAGKKGATKVFKHGRKSPWVPTLAGPFTNGQANAGSWLDIKKSFVLLCPIGEQYLLSSFRELVHDVYCLDHSLSAPKKCTQSGTSIQWISQKS